MSDEFIPDGVRTQRSGEYVKIIFERDDGQFRDVVAHRTWLPSLVTCLLNEIGPGQAVPIDKGSLNFGTTYSVQGFQARPASDGSARLTLFVDLPDQGRVVTIPIDLKPEERSQIIQMLGGQA
jgi:hypothetical protein